MSKEEMISEIEIYLSHVIAKDFPLPKAIRLMYEEYKNSNKAWKKIYDEDQNYIVELNNKILDLEFKIKEQSKEIEELKYHIHYKICAWCGDEFKTKIHNAKYCPKCRREIRISNCKKHYENNKDYFKNYYQNLTDEQKERRRANNREANRRLRERKKANEQRRKKI